MRLFMVLAMVAIIAIAYLGMYRAWNARVSAQANIPAPEAPTQCEVIGGPWPCRYLGATHAGRWLDRIDAHSLGNRSAGELRITTQGIDILRSDEVSFSIRHEQFTAVRADTAIAGRAYEHGGIVVLTATLGETPVDFGLRFPDTADHLAALAALAHREVAS